MLEEVKTTYGVDSFKFDAGELNYIYNIEDYTLSKLPHNDLGFYTKKYVECVSRLGAIIQQHVFRLFDFGFLITNSKLT